MGKNNIDWSKGKANELMQEYTDEIRSVEAKWDKRIAKELGCTPDAVHIKQRREMNDNPDAKNRVTKVKGWQTRLFGKIKRDNQASFDFKE